MTDLCRYRSLWHWLHTVATSTMPSQTESSLPTASICRWLQFFSEYTRASELNKGSHCNALHDYLSETGSLSIKQGMSGIAFGMQGWPTCCEVGWSNADAPELLANRSLWLTDLQTIMSLLSSGPKTWALLLLEFIQRYLSRNQEAEMWTRTNWQYCDKMWQGTALWQAVLRGHVKDAATVHI